MNNPSVEDKPWYLSPDKPFWWPETRDLMAICSTALFVFAYIVPKYFTPPDAWKDIVTQMNGAVILQWGAVMSYYFGTTKGSGAKDQTIATLSSSIGTNGVEEARLRNVDRA